MCISVRPACAVCVCVCGFHSSLSCMELSGSQALPYWNWQHDCPVIAIIIRWLWMLPLPAEIALKHTSDAAELPLLYLHEKIISHARYEQHNRVQWLRANVSWVLHEKSGLGKHCPCCRRAPYAARSTTELPTPVEHQTDTLFMTWYAMFLHLESQLQRHAACITTSATVMA